MVLVNFVVVMMVRKIVGGLKFHSSPCAWEPGGLDLKLHQEWRRKTWQTKRMRKETCSKCREVDETMASLVDMEKRKLSIKEESLSLQREALEIARSQLKVSEEILDRLNRLSSRGNDTCHQITKLYSIPI